MEDYLTELLERLENDNLRPGLKLPEGVVYSSELTVSHTARQEANQLKDKDYIPIFQKLLSKEKVTIKKINIITYLIRLAHKNETHEIADYILEFVKNEKTRWVKDVALEGLNKSNLIINKEREILFTLAEHKDWQIRFSALGLLSKLPKSYHNRIENLCLVQITKYQKKDFSLKTLSNVLSKVGTEKSIPSLKKIVLDSKKSTPIIAALGAIHKINGTKEIQFFIDCFNLKRDSIVKRKLIILICSIGSKEQSELLIKRVKSILSRKRTTSWIYTTGTEPEIVTILKFLETHSSSESGKLITWIKEKKLDYLDKTETEWITQRL